MALITITSAAGAPGVTTTALGLTLAWHRPALLVDADPTGGSAIAAGFFRAERQFSAGLLDLALAARSGETAVAEALPKVVQPLQGKATFLPGTTTHKQAASLAGLWEHLLEPLRALEDGGTDVIIDAGRLGAIGAPTPLMLASDLTLLAVRSHLPALSGARSWAKTLKTDMAATGIGDRFGLLLIGPGQPYGRREVEKVLEVPVITELAWDPVTAEVYSRGATKSRKHPVTALAKGFTASASSIRTTIRHTRTLIGGEGNDV